MTGNVEQFRRALTRRLPLMELHVGQGFGDQVLVRVTRPVTAFGFNAQLEATVAVPGREFDDVVSEDTAQMLANRVANAVQATLVA